MIDPAKVCFYVPHGLSTFKQNLFDRVAASIEAKGGQVNRNNAIALGSLPDDVTPIIGCMLECAPLIAKWRSIGRQFIYWDRGYIRRVFAAWLPRGEMGGMYRWHVNAYQAQRLRDVPADRWERLLPGNSIDPRRIEVSNWKKGGRHIVIAAPSAPYARFHGIEGWAEKTAYKIKRILNINRPIVIREKQSTRSLQEDLANAHCLVAHGSVAAVEAVICGCPVFVHPDSAAALVGLTDLSKIESPIYPERQPWLNSLSYCQFSEAELIDGTLWRLIE